MKKLSLAVLIPFLEKHGGAERYLLECVRYWQHKYAITIYATSIKQELLAQHGIEDHVQLKWLSPYFSDNHSFLLNAILLPKVWRTEVGQHDMYFAHLWPMHLIDRHPMIWFPHEPLRVLYDLRFEQDLEELGSGLARKIHIYPKYNYDRIGNHLFDACLDVIDSMDKSILPEKIVANSQYTAKYLSDIYSMPVHEVVYPGVEQAMFRELPVDPNLFVTIGQLWAHKRIHLLIEAIALTCNTQLLIIGDGPEKETLTKMIEKLGLADRVFIFSGLDNREVSLILSRTCAFLFAAIREPFGIVILEAMAAAKPVIAVNQGGYTEICNSESSFLLAAVPMQFAEKITYLQHHPEIAKKMGIAAKKCAAQYTWEKTAQELESILLATHADYCAKMTAPPVKTQDNAPLLFGIQYYLWYGEGFGGLHWNDNPKSGYVNDKSLLGYYGSSKGETIHYHLDLFERMGIDFVVLNLHIDNHGVNGHEVIGIQHMFDLVKKRQSKIKLVIQIAPYVMDSSADIVKVVEMIKQVYMHHPHYLQIQGKPALFWFWSTILDGDKARIREISHVTSVFYNIAVGLRLPYGVDEAKSTFDFFAGFTLFSPLELSSEENWHKVWTNAYAAAKLAGWHYRGLTVSPGYDDTHLTDELRQGNPYRNIARRDGEVYQKCFDFITQVEEKPDFVMISTFNEFHENSHIEPTVRYGEHYINLTQQLIQKTKEKWTVVK